MNRQWCRREGLYSFWGDLPGERRLNEKPGKTSQKLQRPVRSIPWGLYLGRTSLMVHSVYSIIKSKNLIRTLAPCPRRHSTTSGLPASTAKCRAVYLWLVIVLTFSPLAIIALMTPTWPFWAATWIPLAPCLSKRNNSYLPDFRTIFIFNTEKLKKNLPVGHKQRNTSFM